MVSGNLAPEFTFIIAILHLTISRTLIQHLVSSCIKKSKIYMTNVYLQEYALQREYFTHILVHYEITESRNGKKMANIVPGVGSITT